MKDEEQVIVKIVRLKTIEKSKRSEIIEPMLFELLQFPHDSLL